VSLYNGLVSVKSSLRTVCLNIAVLPVAKVLCIPVVSVTVTVSPNLRLVAGSKVTVSSFKEYVPAILPDSEPSTLKVLAFTVTLLILALNVTEMSVSTATLSWLNEGVLDVTLILAAAATGTWKETMQVTVAIRMDKVG